MGPMMKLRELCINMILLSIHQNQDGFTLLYLAANCGHIDLVKFFSTFTKNSNSPSLNGACTPIGKDQFALNTRVS